MAVSSSVSCVLCGAWLPPETAPGSDGLLRCVWCDARRPEKQTCAECAEEDGPTETLDGELCAAHLGEHEPE